MCVATAGKVISVQENIAQVEFQGNMVRVHAGLSAVRPGDYVLVHAGCIIQKLTKQDNDFVTQLLEELEESASE